MDRASFFSRTPARHFAALAFASMALWGAAAHDTSDGLTISGYGYSAFIAGHPYSFTPTTKNPSGRKLMFSIVGKPVWASFSTSTGHLWGTPGIAYSPSWYGPIKIAVSDGVSTVSLPAFGITVERPDTYPPMISGKPATTVNVNSAYSFRPAAKDPAGNSLWFVVNNKPSWASFNGTTGQLAGMPTAANVGTYSNIVIRVTDGQKTAYLPPFSIQVKGATAPNGPTVSLNASPTNVSKGAASMVSWSSTNATSCTASGGWSGSQPTSGSKSTGALTSSQNYALTCSGSGGSASKSVTVNVPGALK